MNASDELIIVVERRSEAILIARLLKALRGMTPRLFVSEQRTNLATLARNILVHEGGPVLVALNGDSSVERAVAEKKGLASAAIGYVASKEAFAVVAFAPAVEAILFEQPAVLQRHPHAALPSPVLKLGLLDPSGTLKDELGIDPEQLYDNLTVDDLRILSEGLQAQALLAAADRLTRSAAAIEAA